ncbi:hypothetical protein [Leptothoe spongobia]|uniref:Uncharacterized protein n=1 Tax=Leptothoe spongobia TAU-MAC 1115 TaxID=1967444 RepID=A0A947DDT3_9CYAN|nr:hypothetical protein [Leptothoe spongobia]MBT9315152.1 hypothetical protein [Leptothoe spongobia TAU-MAC 1115]
MKFKGLVLGATVAIATLSAMASRADAQTANFDEPTVLETMDEIGAAESGDYSRDRSSFRQTAHYFGLGVPGRSAFPELELDRNSDAILEAYNELMLLQTRNTATIRVPDLPTPYTTSLQRMPGAQSRSRVVGTELNFQPLPRR